MVQEGRQTVLHRAKWKETETKKGMERGKRRAGDGDMGEKKKKLKEYHKTRWNDILTPM